MKRCIRAAAVLLAAAMSFFALTGCSEQAAQETILIPKTVSAALIGDPVSLDPAFASEAQDLTVLSNLYENLLKLSADENGSLTAVPAMAKSYEAEKHIDGSVTYTFRLRSARWSDGTYVTATDFVYDFSECCTHRYFYETCIVDFTADSKYLCTCRLLCTH